MSENEEKELMRIVVTAKKSCAPKVYYYENGVFIPLTRLKFECAVGEVPTVELEKHIIDCDWVDCVK